MKLIRGNLFEPLTYKDENGNALELEPDAICITTNGFVKSDNRAVMGRGCAKEAADKWKDLDGNLGIRIKRKGNVTQFLKSIMIIPNHLTALYSFPVKPISDRCGPHSWNVVKHMRTKFRLGDDVPGWACIADRNLIEESAKQLVLLTKALPCIILPRPGCGAGELDWNEVKPILERHLDDRFYCITF